MKSLGDRIKGYESTTHYQALKRMPLMIRVDGRAFHSFTKGMEPFDKSMMDAMVASAIELANDMQGFKAAFVQSDEATFCLTDYDTVETEGWFDYDLPKVISISAAMMSVYFNKYFPTDRSPVFDSRAFNIPPDDVVNAFLWRAKDWKRNSLQMFSRMYFSHKQLHGKKQTDMHQMLHEIGKNWATDLNDQEKNGTFLIKQNGAIEVRHDIHPTYENIDLEIGHLFK